MPQFSGNRIPTSLARQLVKNYKDLKLETHVPHGRTKSVWFDADTIAKALNVSLPANHTTSGIRIYFAAYEPTVHSGIPHNPDFTERLTLVLVDTIKDGIYDIDQLDDPTAAPGYPKRFTYNDGQICPPAGNCDEGGLLDPKYVP